jgi:hypothetical protein
METNLLLVDTNNNSLVNRLEEELIYTFSITDYIDLDDYHNLDKIIEDYLEGYEKATELVYYLLYEEDGAAFFKLVNELLEWVDEGYQNVLLDTTLLTDNDINFLKAIFDNVYLVESTDDRLILASFKDDDIILAYADESITDILQAL